MLINEDFFDNENDIITSPDEVDDIEKDISYRFTLLYDNTSEKESEYYVKFLSYLFSNLNCIDDFIVEIDQKRKNEIKVHYNLVDNLNLNHLYEYAKLIAKYEMHSHKAVNPYTFIIIDNKKLLTAMISHTVMYHAENFIIAAIFTIHGYQDKFISYIKNKKDLYIDCIANIMEPKLTKHIKQFLKNKDLSYEHIEFFELFRTNASRDTIYSSPSSNWKNKREYGIVVSDHGIIEPDHEELYKSIKDYFNNGGEKHWIETKIGTKDCVLIRYWLHHPYTMHIWSGSHDNGLIIPGIVCVDVIKDRKEWNELYCKPIEKEMAQPVLLARKELKK